MSARPLSYQLVLAGLALLCAIFPWWLVSVGAAVLWAIPLGAIGPLLLLRATWQRARNWSGITALCMIPLSCIGIMDIVATAGEFNAGTVLGVVSILVFFLVLDAGRRAP